MSFRCVVSVPSDGPSAGIVSIEVMGWTRPTLEQVEQIAGSLRSYALGLDTSAPIVNGQDAPA